MIKICNICKKEKDINEFYEDKRRSDGYSNRCQECKRNIYRQRQKDYDKKYHEKRKLEGKCQNCGKIKEDFNKIMCISCRKKRLKYQQSTKGKIIHQKSCKIYQKNNREKRRNYENTKRKTDPYTRIMHCLRERIRQILKSSKKPIKTLEGIGCSKQQLIQHIENQWTNGMSWKNYGSGPGKWNIDHIKPFCLCNKNDIEEIIRNNHYTNLRPLWWEENISRKYNNIENMETKYV